MGVAGTNTKIAVAVGKKYTLPAGTDLNALKSDPLGTLKSVGVASVVPASEKLTLTQEMEAQAVGNGGGYKQQLVINEGVDAAVKAGVLQLAQAGDWNAALRAGGDTSAGEYTFTTFTQHGLSFAPAVKVGGTGFGMEFGATRQDFPSTPTQSASWAGAGTKKAQQQQADGASQK